MSQHRLPAELERYTVAPNWMEAQQDEARRRRACEELRQRVGMLRSR
jgi:hypothetical protein